MKCDVEGCTDPARSRVTWGEGRQQKGNLCKVHIGELWDRAKGLVAMGQLFWIQEPITEAKG